MQVVAIGNVLSDIRIYSKTILEDSNLHTQVELITSRSKREKRTVNGMVKKDSVPQSFICHSQNTETYLLHTKVSIVTTWN